MTIDLYIGRVSTPSSFVRMVAKHIGVDLNIKFLSTFKKEQLEPEFLKMNPFHKLPTLSDDGFVVFESTAICLYLLNKYAPGSELYPNDVQKRARIDQFMAVVTSCVQPRFQDIYNRLGNGALIVNAHLQKLSLLLGKKPTAEQLQALEDLALQGLEFMMGSSKFAVGDELTLADLTLVAILGLVIKTPAFDKSKFPKLSSHYDRVSSLLPYYEETNRGLLEGITGLYDAAK